jgi:hypothetical protein
MWQYLGWIAVVVACVGCADDTEKVRCGNEILDADEACDGSLINSDFVCGDGQQPAGCNECTPDCPERACGNAILEDGEACDGANVPACPTGTLGSVTCSATCEADTSACVPVGGTVMVHVVQGTVDQPNYYVVSHSWDGTPLTECTTNVAGLCAFTNVPADAMITVGYTYDMGSGLSTTLLTTYSHVTAPQTIEHYLAPPPASTTPTTAYVGVPGSYAGATKSVSMNGCTTREHADFTTLHEHSFYDACLDANQQGVAYAEARDDTDTALAWSFQRKTITGTPTFTLPAWSASFSTLTTEITNVPNVDKPLALGCTAVVDQLVPLTRSRTAYPPTSTETFTMVVPSSVTTFARCSVNLGRGSQEGAQFCEQRQTPPFVTFTFDNSDFLPALTSTFTAGIDPINGWTCTLSSQPTPTGDVSQCFKGFYRGGSPTNLIGWTIIAPGTFVGTLKAPTLGPTAPFSLTNVTAVPNDQHARRYAYSDVTGYADYLDGRVTPVTGHTCAVFHSHL